MLSKVQVEERFMKRSELIHKKKDFLQILREHELYDKEQIFTLHRKSKRSAKCSWCKNVLKVGVLTVKVIGAISVPFGKTTTVEQVCFFCPKRHCFTKVPKWCNVKMPIQIVAEKESCTKFCGAFVRFHEIIKLQRSFVSKKWADFQLVGVIQPSCTFFLAEDFLSSLEQYV